MARKSNASGITAMLTMATGVSLAAATALVTEPTLDQVWEDFWNEGLRTCCEYEDPAVQDVCFDVVTDELDNNLDELDEGEKPDDCLSHFFDLLWFCDEDVRLCEEARGPCAEGAQLVYEWCKDTDTDGAAAAMIEWAPSVDVVAFLQATPLTMFTTHPDITEVRLWVLHRGQEDEDQALATQIGRADLVADFGATRVWRYTDVPVAWGMGFQDQVLLVAVAYNDSDNDVGVAVRRVNVTF